MVTKFKFWFYFKFFGGVKLAKNAYPDKYVYSIYSIGFNLSLHYNGGNIFLFVNDKKIYHFKAKNSEVKLYPLCLRNISGDISANNMK